MRRILLGSGIALVATSVVLLVNAGMIRGESGFGYEYFEQDNILIIKDKSDNRTYRIEDSSSYDNFRVRMGVKNPKLQPPTLQRADNTTPEGKKFESEQVDQLLQQANALFFQGKHEPALVLLQQAETSMPESYQVKTMIGSLYFKLGNKEKARAYWMASMKLNPAQPEVVNSLNSLKQE